MARPYRDSSPCRAQCLAGVLRGNAARGRSKLGRGPNGNALEQRSRPSALLERSRSQRSKRVEASPRVFQRQKHLTRTERAEVAKRYRAGESMGSLAVAFGCHRTAIRRAVDHEGVERRDWRTRKVDVEKARERYESGQTAAQIAAEFGVSATAVLNHLRRAGVVLRPRGKVAR
jgi:DNA-directed RNA polymerase specialized sigma24 family protein